LYRTRVDGVSLYRLQRLKYSALHAAADNGHLEVVKALIEYGANVNVQRTVRRPRKLWVLKLRLAKHTFGVQFHLETPLHFAAAGGHVHVVAFLLMNGADRYMFDRVCGIENPAVNVGCPLTQF
jgi:Ankyrin repeat